MALYIGLMSGTSMDGIDAALVDLPSNKLIHGITKKYTDGLKSQIYQLIDQSDLTLVALCQVNTLIGREFASAVHILLKEAKVSAADISAIGSHGQTVCHDTSTEIPYTLQLGCAHTISSLTGIDVVADFRTRDLVNGGQGAPFAPLYHQELFSQLDKDLALVNIGGISNVTFISPNQPPRGWDVGPGNCLMDAWIHKHQGKSFDEEGGWASQGVIIEDLLTHISTDAFFSQPTPKSIGKEYFSLAWLTQFLSDQYKPEDVQATLVAVTARSIADSVLNETLKIKELYLCGGGTHNRLLVQMLTRMLPEVAVGSVLDVGVNPDYLEAMMFAWFASQTLQKRPIDLRAVTGSKAPAILGAIYPAGPKI